MNDMSEVYIHTWFLHFFRRRLNDYLLFQLPQKNRKPLPGPRLLLYEADFVCEFLNINSLHSVGYDKFNEEWAVIPNPEKENGVFTHRTSDLLFEWMYYSHPTSSKNP